MAAPAVPVDASGGGEEGESERRSQAKPLRSNLVQIALRADVRVGLGSRFRSVVRWYLRLVTSRGFAPWATMLFKVTMVAPPPLLRDVIGEMAELVLDLAQLG